MFDFKPKWFESSVEYGEFMTVVIPLLLDTSSLTHTHQQETNHDHSKFDTKSIPLVQSMAHQLRELELPLSLDKRYFLKQVPVLAATHEYIVFPVQMVPSDAQPSMFQQAPSNVDSSAVGSFVHTSGAHQQPPDVVPLEHHHGHRQPAGGRADPNANPSSHPSIEWDGRSNDPSRSHVRQFDEPHADAARLGIWMSNWSNRDFPSTQDRTPTSGMRIPVTAQFLAATPLISDQQKYAMVLKQHQQKRKYHNDPADNDTDLTNVTKDSEEDDGNGTQSDFPSSPRRRDGSFRKNSLEESMSLPIMSADPGGDLGRSHDFRAPSRETIGDETPTYDLREFPTDYSRGPAYHGRDDEERASPLAPMSPPTSNGFHQQPHPLTSSTSNRRFLDDSDPYMSARLEQEDQEKYTVQGNLIVAVGTGPAHESPFYVDTHRSAVSKRSSISQYPPSLDQSSRRSPTRDRHNRRSPTRDGSSRTISNASCQRSTILFSRRSKSTHSASFLSSSNILRRKQSSGSNAVRSFVSSTAPSAWLSSDHGHTYVQPAKIATAPTSYGTLSSETVLCTTRTTAKSAHASFRSSTPSSSSFCTASDTARSSQIVLRAEHDAAIR